MARPKLKGLLYFPLDIDFFEDNSIRIVRARYKSDGVIIYLYLLTQIYREGYYITIMKTVGQTERSEADLEEQKIRTDRAKRARDQEIGDTDNQDENIRDFLKAMRPTQEDLDNLFDDEVEEEEDAEGTEEAGEV